MSKIIKHEIFYPNPVADIWAYLTVPETDETVAYAQPILNLLKAMLFVLPVKQCPIFDFDGIFLLRSTGKLCP